MDERSINKERLEKNYYYLPYEWEKHLFSSKLKELNIRYVLVIKGAFNISGPNYDPKKEYEKLMSCLTKNQAILIYSSNKAAMYEIPSTL